MPFSPSSSFPRPRGTRGKIQKTDRDQHRINERIRVPEVRLIDDQGQQVGVVPTQKALQLARDKGLDLMEVAPNSRPPVCKICDYGKFKYEKKKREHQAKKKQTIIKVKEVQLRPNTDQHDRDYKYRNIRSFLAEGDKAKITMIFRGREITHSKQGFEVMEEIIKMMEDVSTVEAKPRMDGRKMIMVLAPLTNRKAAKSTSSKSG